jgi:flavin reductase (DIM6/NTAB) family NADH-FMN oxidoreductase RutF
VSTPLVRDDALRCQRFRRAAGQFPTGVTLLGTVVDGVPHGMTANAFATVSMDPLLVMVSVSHRTRTYDWIRRSGVFAVTVLGADQEETARWFATRDRPAGAQSFAGVAWRASPRTGAPILVDGVSYFDCRVHEMHPAGDHTVVIGAVDSFDVLSERAPLLFVRSAFTRAPEKGTST